MCLKFWLWRRYNNKDGVYSYKPVFLFAFLSCMNEKGEASLSDVVEAFTWYYEDRIQNGLPAEKKNCIDVEITTYCYTSYVLKKKHIYTVSILRFPFPFYQS